MGTISRGSYIHQPRTLLRSAYSSSGGCHCIYCYHTAYLESTPGARGSNAVAFRAPAGLRDKLHTVTCHCVTVCVRVCVMLGRWLHCAVSMVCPKNCKCSMQCVSLNSDICWFHFSGQAEYLYARHVLLTSTCFAY